jgi:hypothetical protein
MQRVELADLRVLETAEETAKMVTQDVLSLELLLQIIQVQQQVVQR